MSTISNWLVQNRAYFVAYAGWVLAAGVGALPLLFGPAPLASLLELLDVNYWIISAIQRFSYVFLGLGWLVGVLYAEHYLRTSVPRHRLRKALVRTGITLLVILILLVLVTLLPAFL